MDTYVVAYCLLVGVAVLGLWAMLFVRGQVPEAQTAPWSLACHVAAEVLMAVILLVVAWAGWRGYPAPRSAWLGLGMVIYSTINSAGYYAQRRVWGPVALFAVLLAGAVIAGLRIGSAG
jgi:hypothetical protein